MKYNSKKFILVLTVLILCVFLQISFQPFEVNANSSLSSGEVINVASNQATNNAENDTLDQEKKDASIEDEQTSALPMYIILAVLLIGSFVIRLVYYKSKKIKD